MKNTSGNWWNMTPKTKHITLKDMDKLTLSFLKQHAKQRKKELHRNKWASGHLNLDINKWVIRANPDGTIIMLAPVHL